MSVAGVSGNLAASVLKLKVGTAQPIVLAVSAVVLLGIQIFKLAQDQEKKLQEEIDLLQEALNTHRELRAVRGEQREALFGAMANILQTVDVASRVLPKAEAAKARMLDDHHAVLSEVIDSVQQIRAQYSPSRRFVKDLDASKELANEINQNVPLDAVQLFRQKMQQARALLESERET